MSSSTLTLRHLCFTGPDKEPALLTFGPGLNVVYGASETGKSFLLESLDFMLGSGKALRDIPERVGYDRIWLGLEKDDGEAFTLERSSNGGNFRFYEGLHTEPPEHIEPISLAQKHNPTREDNLSTYLLKAIGLSGKKVKKNARGETNNLTFRYLSHLCLVGEGSIQKEGSPFETDQFTSRTAEMSVLKLLLTGVDDSALQAAVPSEKETLSKTAKLEVIDELISEHKDRLTSLVGDEDDPQELSSQLERLEGSLTKERSSIQESEAEYRELLQRRNELRRKLESASDRQTEIAELQARFSLLDQHYQSDLERLEGVQEAGSLVSALSPQTCPLCGAIPEQQNHEGNCDGNVELVVKAADAESKKIIRLRKELQETVGHLNSEADGFVSLVPQLKDRLEALNSDLKEKAPSLSDQRGFYSDLIDKKSTVQNALNLLSSISELEDRKIMIEDVKTPKEDADVTSSELSTSTLDKFSKLYEDVLKSWNFPDAERVHFDRTTRDFVISGKPRGSRGKGMRAITYSAFTVSLLEYTRKNKLPHPGFVVLDTPLLAYREPEGEEDDLSGTDVQDRFYEYLDSMNDRQTIILENVDPPESIKAHSQSTFFGKNPHQGRYGFFPI
ncbi:MAG: hypothetical protein ABW098_18825 [Candidatus Thiodiazotropha sp.]